IPKSYKTLLSTPKNLQIREFNDGSQIWYKGIKKNLNAIQLEQYLHVHAKIVIDINIDGLPLFKSSKMKFWPILGYLIKTKNDPFIIAIYFGRKDPQDLNTFLIEYVDEVEDLHNNGYIFNNKRYSFQIRHYICDAPARSFVKCCIGHCGYASCEKCTVIGEWFEDRVTYIKMDEALRTDYSFLQQTQLQHHQGHSILERINTGMVSQFRLDSLHLVYLGVFKRLLTAWLKWNGPWKLHRTVVVAISRMLQSVLDYCPQDFNRKPRSLEELKLFKGTEFRRLCLYDGILVFRDFLNEGIYKNFLLLHSAIYILSSPILVHSMSDYANQLLRTFITHSSTIYGKKFVVYNVHALSHLAEECTLHGHLDQYSAFRYENFLKSIKDTLKSGYMPLHQVANRDSERNTSIPIILEINGQEIKLSKK
ncbi:hypothetical protein ALC62_00868, partial [Cyphomyrmex costatus]